MKGLEHHAPMEASEYNQYNEPLEHYRVSPQWLPCSEAAYQRHDEDSREIIPIRLDPDKYATEEMSVVR